MHKNKDYVSPDSLQPYEKFAELGAERLSDAELLAIIIRSGTRDSNALKVATELLNLYGREDGILNLMYYTDSDFRSIRGIGPVKATQLAAISELSKRIWKTRSRRRVTLSTPSSIADLYMEELRYCNQERVYLLLLDSQNRLLQSVPVSQGTVNASAISAREIFFVAIKYRAAAFVIVHNHPSGSTRPSEADINFAIMLRMLGQMMNIPLMDCLIIGDNEYLSFSEAGLFRKGDSL